MLIFVDQLKNIKIIRAENTEDGGVSRTRLGTLPKNRDDIPDEIKKLLRNGELEEVNNVIEAYKKAQHIQMHANLLRFPQIIREAYEFVSSGHAEETEKRLFISSIVETLRLIRKSDREQEK